MKVAEIADILEGGFPDGELEHVEVDLSQFEDECLPILNFVKGYQVNTYRLGEEYRTLVTKEGEREYCMQPALERPHEQIVGKNFDKLKDAVQFHFDMKFYLSKGYIKN